MGGPIIRSGASPEFSKNWERIFGSQSSGGTKKAATKKAAPKKPAAKKKSAKK